MVPDPIRKPDGRRHHMEKTTNSQNVFVAPLALGARTLGKLIRPGQVAVLDVEEPEEIVVPDRCAEPGLVDLNEMSAAVMRTFAFIDLCGFTTFTAEHGVAEASNALTTFRAIVRGVAARRGVRVARWIGDGALLVGVDPEPLVATVVDLCTRTKTARLPIRAGITKGEALIFEGNDYIGRPLNLAARLCDYTEPSMVLADVEAARYVPDWVSVSKPVTVQLRGLGRVKAYALSTSSPVEQVAIG